MSYSKKTFCFLVIFTMFVWLCVNTACIVDLYMRVGVCVDPQDVCDIIYDASFDYITEPPIASGIDDIDTVVALPDPNAIKPERYCYPPLSDIENRENCEEILALPDSNAARPEHFYPLDHVVSIKEMVTEEPKGIIQTPAGSVVEWAHGYQTDRVVATRYTNPRGYNIGFRFPKNPSAYDRREVVEWFEDRGGWVIECGGYPGAEMLVRFQSVYNKETTNKKLVAILPELNRFMEGL